MSDKEQLLMSYLTDLENLEDSLALLYNNEVSLYSGILQDISDQCRTVLTLLEGQRTFAPLTPLAGADSVAT